jgi:hypothetical protein
MHEALGLIPALGRKGGRERRRKEGMKRGKKESPES